MTQEEIRKLYEKHSGDPEAIARELNIDPEMLSGLSQLPTSTSQYHFHYLIERVPPNDLGPESLRRFIISTRHVYDPEWPRKDIEVIKAARLKYDAGTHEIFQGRDPRRWVILYCKPRRKPEYKRRPYFTSEDFQ